MSFEECSQEHLVWLATLIRESGEYDISPKNKNELNKIVHHDQKDTNKYNGAWSLEIKNYVCHQIFNRIIPVDKRNQYIKDNPLQKVVDELHQEVEKQSECSSLAVTTMIHGIKEKNYLSNKLKKYEADEQVGYIKLISELRNRIEHYEDNFVKPLIYLQWIDEKDIEPFTFKTKLPEDIKKLFQMSFVANIRLVNRLPHVDRLKHIIHQCNESNRLNQLLHKKVAYLQEEHKKLKLDNDLLRKDNIDKIEQLFQ